jgi:hypothetical protein
MKRLIPSLLLLATFGLLAWQLILLCYKIDSLWWIFLALGSRSG